MKRQVLIIAAMAAIATPALALTADRAQSLLASGRYHLYDGEFSWDDDYVKQATSLIANERYGEALRVVETLDRQNGFEGSNIDFIPDVAIVAAAASDMALSDRYTTLAVEIASAASHHAMCREDGDGYRLEFPRPVHLTMENEVTSRTCNAFLIDKPVEIYPDFRHKLKWLD